jgi:hypothetical protein
MNSTHRSIRLGTLAVAAAFALGACNKEAPPPPPPAAAPAPMPAPAPPPPAPAEPAPPPAATGTTLQSVEVGSAVDASGKLSGAPMSTFKPKDTIYAVVTTNNAGSAPANITAHWTYNGTDTVNDSSQTVTASGPSVTNFHIEKPNGFPAGAYAVTISIDGKEVATKDFEVK